MSASGLPERPGLRLDQAQVADLSARHAAVMGGAQLEELRALGLDVVEAERGGPFVTGTDGRRYLDCISGGGIFNLGRRPQEVIDGLREAVTLVDQGNFPLISEEKADFAARLAGFVPGDLECALFSVSRGEALDFACKLARACTGRPGLVTVDGGWYGQTGFALSLSERAGAERFGPLIPGVTRVPLNDIAAADLALHGTTAAMVLEPVQAENGCRCVEPAYLREVARLCRERGALLILDETQTGMGRTGTRFAYGHWGVVPDILVLGESVAAGVFPICATLFRPDLETFLNEHPLIHLSTFGGSDVGCLVGLRALDVYERERPWQNAAEMGERLRASLSALAAERPGIVKGVSGLGLLLALDLGGEEAATAFCRGLAAAGVLALPGMVARGTVVLRPSLLIGDEECEQLVAACATAAESAAAAVKPKRRRHAPAPAAGAAAKQAVAEAVVLDEAGTQKAAEPMAAKATKTSAADAAQPKVAKAAATKPAADSAQPKAAKTAAKKPAAELTQSEAARKPAANPAKPDPAQSKAAKPRARRPPAAGGTPKSDAQPADAPAQPKPRAGRKRAAEQ